MIGLGTIINAGAIIVGGLIGLLIGKGLKSRFQNIIMVAMGLSVFAMAVSGFVAKMLVITEDGVSTTGVYVVIFSLVIGGVIGELINIDGGIERFGTWLKEKTKSQSDNSFVDGFVSASLTVCIGAMAIVGALMDGMNGDYSILLTKSIMDMIIILIMSASKGKGCIFSAIPVFILQGSVTLFARVLMPIMNQLAIDSLSMVGNILIMCIGINIIADGKYRIKVGNFLPSIIFAVVSAYIPFLW